MRIADITTPGDYEVQYGQRVTIVAIEKRARKVYDRVGWDMHGHEVISKMAVDDTGRLYTPQQILRPWAAAQAGKDREASLAALQSETVRNLRTALGERVRDVQAEYDWMRHTRCLHSISVTLSVTQAAELTAWLSEKTES